MDEQGDKKVHKLRISVDELISLSSDNDKGAKKKQKRKKSPSPPPTNAKKKKSSRISSMASKKRSGDSESEDLTKDFEDPISENLITEVPLSKLSQLVSNSGVPVKKDNDLQPLKVGTVTDLDENGERIAGTGN